MGLTHWPHGLVMADNTTNTNTTAPAASPQAAAPSAAESLIPLTELDATSAATLAAWRKQDKPSGSTDAGNGSGDNLADDDSSDEEDEDGTDEDQGQDQSDDSEDNAGDGDGSDDTDGDGEDTDDGDDEADGPEKTPVQKRIDKLTGQKKDLQARLAAAEAEVATLKSAGPKPGQPLALVPMPEDPLSTLTTPADVDNAMERARETIKWAKANKHGASVPTAPGSKETVELSAEQIEELRDEAEELLREHGPNRKKWLDGYEASHKLALDSYPDMFKAGSPDQQYIAEVIKHVPGLARHPMHEVFIGDMLTGAQIRSGRLKLVRADSKATAAAPTRKSASNKPVPSLSTEARSPAPRPRGAKPDTSDVRDKAFAGKTNARDAVEAMLANKFS